MPPVVRRPLRPFIALSIGVLVAVVVAACHGGTDASVTPVQDASLRTGGIRTAGGEADALAAALLFSTDSVSGRPVAMTNVALREVLQRFSRDHVHAAALHAGAGADLAGSATVRRLAALPWAPVDGNGNGTNLDETRDAMEREFAVRAGAAAVPSGMRSILFPWRDGSAEFAAAGDPRMPTQRTKDGVTGEVDLAQVGFAMTARLALAVGLFERDRSGLPGATPAEGVLGLMLLQQVVAMEETLFASLFMDGAVLAGLPFPTDYEPEQGLVWLPRSFRVDLDANGLPASYALRDRASSLEGLASMLRAGGLLAFLASPANPNKSLLDALSGMPFGTLPRPEPEGEGRDHDIVTWEGGVKQLLAQWCVGCHPPNFGFNDFSANTYENVLRGGRNSRPGSSTPIITRGDPDNSLLYTILLPNPPKNLQRMPRGGPYFVGKDLDLIRQWILDGARSAPPGPPRVGLDLAVTMYKNLVAMHVGNEGGLFELHDGTAPVPFANAAATGAALQALAAVAHLRSELSDYEATLRKVAESAVATLTRDTGEVIASYRMEDRTGEGAADLLGHARMTAGLFAVGRVLDDSEILARAEMLGKRLLRDFFVDGKRLFSITPGREGVRYTPVIIAAVVDASREMRDLVVQRGPNQPAVSAVEVHERFLVRLLPALVFSELDGGGEILGDGIPDTDANGIPEPALAGGSFGRAPLLVGEILEGSTSQIPVDPRISWSRHIQPLFRAKCGECHMDGSTRGDGYALDTPALLRRPIHGQNPMQLLVPFDPENSFLYRKLVDRNPTFGAQMPEARPPLADHGKELVRQWILQGATIR